LSTCFFIKERKIKEGIVYGADIMTQSHCVSSHVSRGECRTAPDGCRPLDHLYPKSIRLVFPYTASPKTVKLPNVAAWQTILTCLPCRWQVRNKLATSRCNGIWETTRHNGHDGLVTDLLRGNWCNGFWPCRKRDASL